MAGVDPNEWKKWDPKSKERFITALEASERTKKVWYCLKGRECDGKPHDQYDYPHARGDQWPPSGKGWTVWLLKGGRGSGKTRSGAEWIRNMSKTLERTSIIGPSWQHVRDTMIEGDSGLLVVFENAKQSVVWEPSKKKLTVPCECKKTKYGKAPHRKGHFIQAFTGEEPERLRGPQHAAVWLDEPAHFALIDATWDNMMFGLRLGQRPVVLCSTTPLPTKWMKKLIAHKDTISVTVSTFKNMDNLAPTFRQAMLDRYEGTRLGRQELHGEVLEDIVGALWSYAMIEGYRVERIEEGEGESATGRPALTYQDMDRIIVGVDPAGSSDRKRDETGIVVVGKKGEHFYVIDDLSGHYTPNGWATAVWDAYEKYQADMIVAEKNYGGEMVLSTLTNVRTDGRIELVTSRRGKVLRAEPIVGLYEQERVHHFTQFEELETQMCFPGYVEVTTKRGQVPIRDVTTDDMVMTRAGWAPLVFAGQTGVADTLTRVTHSGDCTVDSTACHPIWTETNGFVDAENVQPGDRLGVLTAEQIQSLGEGTGITSCLPAITATAGVQAADGPACSCIVPSGKRTTDPSRTDTSSITAMKIQPTTSWTISNSPHAASTTSSTTGEATSAISALTSDQNTPSGLGQDGNLSSESVPAVESASHLPGCALNFAPSLVDVATTASIEVTEQPVYDLTVADGYPHEFYANGVLVHNCEWVPATQDSPDRVDALVHGMTALAGIEAPTSIAVPTGSMTGRSDMGAGMHLGMGAGMGAMAGMSSMFGYTPREAEIVETAQQTIDRLESILKTAALYLPRRNPCNEGEHPAYFEAEADDGKLLCSRCLHEVVDEGGTLVRKHAASSLAMSS